jgi:glycerophosphoryl diester phosphodiesterase
MGADHAEFASRNTTKVIDGVALTGWFNEHFTLVELRTLRSKERISQIRQRNRIYDRRYRVSTFDSVISLVKHLTRERGRPIADRHAVAASTPSGSGLVR